MGDGEAYLLDVVRTPRGRAASRGSLHGHTAKLHDALEPEQRERLADLVERGPRLGWMRGGW